MEHDGDSGDLPASGALVLFQFISLGLIVAVGSAGNALVLYAFSRHFRISRPPYLLMVGFISLDLVRLCLCFPLVFVAVVHPLKSEGLCRWVALTNAFCLLGNELSLLGMAVDRYVDNKHRMLYRRRWHGSVGASMLVTLWGLALLLTFQATSISRQTRLQAKCTFPSHSDARTADVLGWLVSSSVSFLLTTLIYVRLFFFLRGRRRMRPVLYEPAVSENWGFYGVPVTNRWLAHSLSDTPIAVLSRVPTNYDVALWRSKKQKQNEKLTKVCFVIHIIFSITCLPYVVISFCSVFNRSYVPQWVEMSATWLTYIQVTITPFTFLSLSGLSRNKIRMWNGKRRPSPTLSSHSSL